MIPNLWALNDVGVRYMMMQAGRRGGLDRAAVLDSHQANIPTSYFLRSVDGVSFVSIRGIMSPDPLPSEFSPTYSDIRRALRAADADPDTGSILLGPYTPGGAVDDMLETAELVSSLSKPTVAHVESLCASAGYALVAGASEIIVGRTGELGSIGAYATLVDYSQYAEDQGLKVIVVRSAEMKGHGVPGTEITEEVQEYVQSIVDVHAKAFVDHVAAGRGMKAADVPHDGRVYIGKAAVRMGLADSVGNSDFALARAKKLGGGTSSSGTRRRADARIRVAKARASLLS